MGGAIAGIGGALLGGIAGSQKSVTSGESTSESGLRLGAASELENKSTADIQKQYEMLQKLGGFGAGEQDVTAGIGSQRDLATMLQQLVSGGSGPNASDIESSQQLARQLYAPQEVALGQQQEQERIRAERLAAQLGRPVNDPIIQARLSQERIRQQSSLEAQRGSFAAQNAQQQPFQRLQLAGQLADVRGNLATQAFSNRQALLSLGQNIQSQERNFRLQTAGHYSRGTTSQESGGGISGAINGALGGAGAGLGLASKLKSFGSGGMDEVKSIFGNSTPTPLPSNTGDFGSISGMSGAAPSTTRGGYRGPSNVGVPDFLAPLGSSLSYSDFNRPPFLD